MSNPHPRLENLRPVKKGQTGNPNGRPPKLLTAITRELQENGYKRVSPSQIVEAYELLLGLDEAKIKETMSDDKSPMILRIVGKAMLSNKGIEILEKMLDRVHGKAVQPTENININNENREPALRDAIRRLISKNDPS